MRDVRPAQLTAATLQTGRNDIVAALKVLRDESLDEDLEAQRLRAAISVMRRFYSTFFDAVYGTPVRGFGWQEKRKAVGAILDHESEEPSDGDRPGLTRYELAVLFEELSDELHGDVEFGYTDDVTALRAFGDEFLETWRDRALDWLEATDPAVGKTLREEFDADGEPPI